MESLIRRAEDVTATWLTDRLQQRGDLSKGTVQCVMIGETIETTSSLVTPIRVTYPAETSTNEARSAPSALIYKTARPGWYWGLWAETILYKEIAAEMHQPPVPRCFYTGLDQEQEFVATLLEDVSTTHERLPSPTPPNRPTAPEMEKVIDALLSFHIRWWNHSYVDERLVHEQGGPLVMGHAALPEVVRIYCNQMRDNFPKIIEDSGDNLKPEWEDICRKSIAVWPKLMIDRIQSGKGLTMIHGDFHLWNIFFPVDAQNDHPLILDWETFRRGFGPYDLAYMLISSDDIALRRRWEQPLLKRYHDGLLAGGIEKYTWKDCVEDYRLGVMANLFPPLNWRRLDALESAMTAFTDWKCNALLE